MAKDFLTFEHRIKDYEIETRSKSFHDQTISCCSSAHNLIKVPPHQPGPDYVIDKKIFPSGIHINTKNKGTLSISHCIIGCDGFAVEDHALKTQELLGDDFVLPYGTKWSNRSYFPDNNGELLEIETESPTLVWADTLEVYDEKKHGFMSSGEDVDHINFCDEYESE